ncbi:MmpS family protein [Acaricomes phytoseiuli]|uniref:MmpS family transport accessory protein n=1 Tax=Acaricomes phytoseiuli TaxID=291968 RepID=UPI0003672594|nr:MmpS family transport accessory protein [Acaricomes phytoseiuli]MCW1250530.1 MmpS family protein [Acaricomes phytoseiuli]
MADYTNYPAPSSAPLPPAAAKRNGLAIAALILGIIAFILAFIPFINVLSFLLGLIGLILAIVALVKKQSKGMSITGLALSGLSLIIAALVTVLVAVGIGFLSNAASSAASAPPGTVVYEVTSDAPTAASVTYMALGDDEIQQQNAIALPFSQTESFQPAAFNLNAFSLTATAAPEATSISCKITVNGVVKDENTVNGPSATVSCTGAP